MGMVLLPTMRMSATGSFVAESDGPEISRLSFFLPNIDEGAGISGIPPPPGWANAPKGARDSEIISPARTSQAQV